MADLTVRTLTQDDFPELTTLVSGAFLSDPRPEDEPLHRAVFEPQRFHGVYDGGRLIGSTGIQSRDLTLPGARPAPVAAVTAVGVAPDARRRGALTAAMRAQLDELHASHAEPVAVLWASQAPIYGRFGYGMATRQAELKLMARAEFRPGVDAGGRVEMLEKAAAEPVLRRVHGVVAPRRVGWLSRSDAIWAHLLDDQERHREGASTYRFAVHHGGNGPDGYARFRVRHGWESTGPDYQLVVHEMAAATPQACAALWRLLLDLDLVGRLSCDVALDDPLPWLLADPSGVLTGVGAGLWVRLVDVDRALTARHYNGPCDVVLELTDTFCPWNAGRWRLVVGDTGSADVSRSDAVSDLRCDVADLGSASLGGPRRAARAAAGRVHELRDGALAAVSRAFGEDVEPYCPEVF